jgi:dsDNA-specific endonuclease/ATPase MutS2
VAANALRGPRCVVASVEVDERGRPLYRLAIGKAGESSALAVARRAGVPEAIVARAEAIVRGR